MSNEQVIQNNGSRFIVFKADYRQSPRDRKALYNSFFSRGSTFKPSIIPAENFDPMSQMLVTFYTYFRSVNNHIPGIVDDCGFFTPLSYNAETLDASLGHSIDDCIILSAQSLITGLFRGKTADETMKFVEKTDILTLGATSLNSVELSIITAIVVDDETLEQHMPLFSRSKPDLTLYSVASLLPTLSENPLRDFISL